MGLEAISGVGPATLKKLNQVGVRTIDDVRTMDIATVANKTGLATDRLKEWQTTAKQVHVIEDVAGIGPATLKKLKSAGVADLGKFAAADTAALAKKTGVAASRLAAWQTEAKKLTAPAKPKAAGKKAPTRAPAKTTKPTAAGRAATPVTPTAVPEAVLAPIVELDPVGRPTSDEPALLLAGTNGSHEYRNGHDGGTMDEGPGFFRKVMTFLTGGPTR